MIPTQYELATLAAAIPIPDCWKDDEDNREELVYRANRAFDLWQICGGLIAAAPEALAAKAEKVETRALFYSQFSEFSDTGSVPLEAFLKAVMPSKPLADSTLTWWRFRTRNLEGWDQISNRMKPDSIEGLSLVGLHIICGQFLRFNAERAAVIASDKAATAARARHLPERQEADAKSEAAEARNGRGYVAPKPGLSLDALFGKAIMGAAKAQERRLSAKKRAAKPGIETSAPKQAPATSTQKPAPAKQKKTPRKQKS